MDATLELEFTPARPHALPSPPSLTSSWAVDFIRHRCRSTGARLPFVSGSCSQTFPLGGRCPQVIHRDANFTVCPLYRGQQELSVELPIPKIVREPDIPVSTSPCRAAPPRNDDADGGKGGHHRGFEGLARFVCDQTEASFTVSLDQNRAEPESARRWRRVARSCRSRLRSTALLTSRTGCSAGRPS
jgi:hypothetical protein